LGSQSFAPQSCLRDMCLPTTPVVEAASAQLNRISQAVSDLATRGAHAGTSEEEHTALLAAASSCKMRATHMRNPVVEEARASVLTYDELA
jgi:hypothetical protein